MAYVKGFTKRAKDLMASPNVNATTIASEYTPSDNMLSFLQKSGPSYVCLDHHGKTKELCGNSVKAAHTEANPHDLSGELTNLSLIPTDDTDDASPFMRSQYLWRWQRLPLLRNMLGKADLLLLLGKNGIFSLAVVGFTRRQTHVPRFSRSYMRCGTHETSNECRPSLTLSVKNSNGRVTVVVRSIAPNERSWDFHWLFQESLPVLLGAQSLHSVKL
jgi:hypothetical protein